MTLSMIADVVVIHLPNPLRGSSLYALGDGFLVMTWGKIRSGTIQGRSSGPAASINFVKNAMGCREVRDRV